MVLFLFLLVFNIPFASAEATQTTATTSGEYSLLDLEPVSYSYYPTRDPDSFRTYFQLKNETGNHYFIYEETKKLAPDKMMAMLRTEWANPGVRCSAKLSCKGRPFCTGKCKKMYYPIANFNDPNIDYPKDLCTISFFTCQKITEAKPTASPEVYKNFKSGH